MYDPRLRTVIKEQLFVTMYDTINQRLYKKINHLIEQNAIACNYIHRSFVFRNQLYQNDPAPPPRPSNRLHPTLLPIMASYIDEFNALNDEEIPFIQGYLARVLNAFKNLEDCLEFLPDTLKPVLLGFIAQYPTTSPRVSPDVLAKFKLENDQYLDKFKQYMVMNLIR
jgi:hypothetical protein